MNQSPPNSSQHRKEDVLIYVIALFFFFCIVSGGAFLGLYLFLPQPQPWFPILGLVLVAIPWLFWLFTFLYRCCSPRNSQPPQTFNKPAPRSAASVFDNPPLAADSVQQNAEPHLLSDSATGGGRRVQFGSVIVITENENEKDDKSTPAHDDQGVDRPSQPEDDQGSSSSLLLLPKDGEVDK